MSSKKHDPLLTLNSDSSNVKFSLFSVENTSSSVVCVSLLLLYSGHYLNKDLNIAGVPELQIRDSNGQLLQQKLIPANNHKQALQSVLQWLKHDTLSLIGVEHRIVYGGARFYAPMLVSNGVLYYLESLIPLAQNHQPANLLNVKLLIMMRPDIPKPEQAWVIPTNEERMIAQTSWHILQ